MDAEMVRLRTEYRAYVQRILELAEYPAASAAADRIVDLETKIARAHETREESDDFAAGRDGMEPD